MWYEEQEYEVEVRAFYRDSANLDEDKRPTEVPIFSRSLTRTVNNLTPRLLDPVSSELYDAVSQFECEQVTGHVDTDDGYCLNCGAIVVKELDADDERKRLKEEGLPF